MPRQFKVFHICEKTVLLGSAYHKPRLDHALGNCQGYSSKCKSGFPVARCTVWERQFLEKYIHGLEVLLARF